jgi:hypothetical protein
VAPVALLVLFKAPERVQYIMWEWLNNNSGAVQALGSVVTVLLTVFLGMTTLWYARLTKRLAELTRIQFTSTVQPKLEVALTKGYPLPEHHLQYFIKNVGAYPAEIWSIALTIFFQITGSEYRSKHCFINRYIWQTLMPGQTTEDIVDMTEYVKVKPSWAPEEVVTGYRGEMHVDCSDLAHSAQHCFVTSTDGRSRHMPHFLISRRAAASV